MYNDKTREMKVNSTNYEVTYDMLIPFSKSFNFRQ